MKLTEYQAEYAGRNNEFIQEKIERLQEHLAELETLLKMRDGQLKRGEFCHECHEVVDNADHKALYKHMKAHGYTRRMTDEEGSHTVYLNKSLLEPKEMN